MRFVLGLCLSLACIVSWAEQPWSLERCIEYAVEHNIEVKQRSTDVRLSELGVQQSRWDYSPSLSANGSYSANFGRSLDPTTYDFVNNQSVNNVNGSVSLSTQAFGGMRKMHALKRSELDLLASIKDVEQVRNNVTIAVAAAYLQILYNKEQVVNSQAQIATLEHQVERTRKLVDAGSLALGALLDLQSQMATEEYNLVSYRNAHDLAMLTLTQLLELRGVEGFDVEIPLLDGIGDGKTDQLDTIFSSALNLPQIEAAQLRVSSSERGIALARAQYYPTVDVGVQLGSSFSDARQKPHMGVDGETYYSDYPFFDQFGDNSSTSIHVSLGVPIFNGLTSRRNVGVAKVRKLQSLLSLAQTKNILYKEIGQAVSDATGAAQRYRAAQSSVAATTQSFSYAENKFSAGALNSTDYNVAKNNLIVAQSVLTQAKYEYIFKSKILDFYQGRPIKL